MKNEMRQVLERFHREVFLDDRIAALEQKHQQEGASFSRPATHRIAQGDEDDQKWHRTGAA